MLKKIILNKDSRLLLQLEMIKDYKSIVLLQSCMIFCSMLLDDLLLLTGMHAGTAHHVCHTLFLLLTGVYIAVLWDILRNYSQNKFIIYATLTGIVIAFGLMLVTVNPFFTLFPGEKEAQPYLLIIHTLLFIAEATVTYFTILNIFQGEKLSTEKIWGSACIFFMIGFSFASMFDLILIAAPLSMGVPVKIGLESYMCCIHYSMTIIGGHDAFPNASSLIVNTGVIEAVWSNLFIVLLVGRLLGKPSEEK